MKIDKLPNTLILGDTINAHARLFEEGKTITNPNLLDKTKFVLKLADNKEQPVSSLDMKDDGQAPDVLKGDGVFTATVADIKQASEYVLIFQAMSLTFQREVKHSLHVYDSPATVEISQAAADKPFRISIKPHAGLIRPESVSMQLKLPALEPQTINHITDEEWLIEVPAKHANEKIILTMAATRYDDKPLKIDFEHSLLAATQPQSLAVKITPSVPVVTEHEKSKAKEGDDEKLTTEEDPQDKNDEPEDKSKGFNWKLVLISVVLANILVFGGGWFVYRRIRKRRQQAASTEEKDLAV